MLEGSPRGIRTAGVGLSLLASQPTASGGLKQAALSLSQENTPKQVKPRPK